MTTPRRSTDDRRSARDRRAPFLVAALATALAACGVAPTASETATATPPAADTVRPAAAPAPAAPAATDPRRAACQALLDELVARGVPGVSAALVWPDGRAWTLVSGVASRESGAPLRPSDRFLVGSSGKSFVTAVAHRLVERGQLDLNARAASHFPSGADEPEWIARVPNAREVTLRQLLAHRTGIPRYVFAPDFGPRLSAEPDKHWRPEELLAHVFDAPPRFAPGADFAYADTNYVIVGMVIEVVTGRAFYELAREQFVLPLELADTVPSDARRVPGLVQGHVVAGRALGVGPRALGDDGRTTYNVQFEWCGGGWASTPRDLARWARALYAGDALSAASRASLLAGRPAPELGPGVDYGLGVMLRDTSLGPFRGHDGFMPGYVTSMGVFVESGLGVALQLNTDDTRPLGRPPVALLEELARLAAD